MAVFFFQQDGFHPQAKRIVGRPVAGLGLLKAAARGAAPGPLRLLGLEPAQLDAFLALESAEGILAPGQELDWLDGLHHPTVSTIGTVYLHGPGLVSEFAWRRRARDPGAFSLCGIHHTFSTHDMLDALGRLVLAPLMPWDALVCTSRAARSAVESVIAAQEAYLEERCGGPVRIPRLQLPVVPLGVSCDDFDPGAERRAAARQGWRARLGVGDADPVVLSFGRQSFLGKAHPLPLFRALEHVAAAVDQPLHLILAGWFPSPEMETQFRTAAEAVCPRVRIHWLDGNSPETRRTIWHAADLFVSASDTIQESFGLTPVEAMAAGLPAVVSDWNGYRDTVVDAVTGFRVPTYAPAPGFGDSLAEWYGNGLVGPDAYEGMAALATAVDIGGLAERIRVLVTDAPRRAAMADAARSHARACFDWSVVHRQLTDVWRELAAIRQAARPAAKGPPPLRADPFHTFAAYPTRHLTPDCVLVAEPVSPAYLAMLTRMEMTTFGGEALGMNDLALALRDAVLRAPRRLGDMLPPDPGVDRDRVMWTAGLLLKFGLVRLVEPPAC